MEKVLIILSPQSMPMEEPFKENYNYTNAYNSRAVLKAGGIPLMPPFLKEAEAETLMEKADGLFLTGGASVDPGLYGEKKQEFCRETDPERDKSDAALLAAALKYERPVLCVCRGFQFANVYFGGSLYQDIRSQTGSSIRHSLCRYPEYTRECAHSVRAEEGTPLAELLGEKSFMVNSLHHQGIKKLAPGLRSMARAEDGLIEGWYLPSERQWIRAYQWHPEMLEDSPGGEKIFLDFINACKNKRT